MASVADPDVSVEFIETEPILTGNDMFRHENGM